MAHEGIVRVAIVHRGRLVREGLAFVLARHHALSVVATAGDLAELSEKLEAQRPDVYLVDLRPPEREGLNDLLTIRSRVAESKVLMTGLCDLDADALACIEHGAAGYVSQDTSLQDLIENIRAVAAGEAICSRKLASLLFARVADAARQRRPGPTGAPPRVTPREREIIVLINMGLSNKEIAVRLRIEIQTVKNHVHNILDKLQIDGRRALASYVSDRPPAPRLGPGTSTFGRPAPAGPRSA